MPSRTREWRRSGIYKVILKEMEAELRVTEEQTTKHSRNHAATMRVIEQLKSDKLHTHRLGCLKYRMWL